MAAVAARGRGPAGHVPRLERPLRRLCPGGQNKPELINQSINKFITGNKAHEHTDTQTNRKTDTNVQKSRNKKQVPGDTNMHTQNTNQHSIQMSCF